MEIASGIDHKRQQAEIEKARAEAELKGFKDSNETAHKQHMESMEITKDMLGAANGNASSSSDAVIVCPKCKGTNKMGSTFCATCGSRLQGGEF